MLVVNQHGMIVLANVEASRLFGYSPLQLTALNVDSLVPVELRSEHQHMRTAFNEKPSARQMGSQRQLEAVHRDGHHFPVEAGLSWFGEGEHFRVIVAIHDITARKRAQDELERAAYEDTLTGLLSRKGFIRHLDRLLLEGNLNPASLVVAVDIKALREVNNTQGYGAGDAVLREVARRLRVELGAELPAARINGGGFALLAPLDKHHPPGHWRSRLEAVFGADFLINNFCIHVEARFGYVRVHRSAQDGQKLLLKAELALYESQTSLAVHWTQYTKSLERRVRESVNVTRQLRRAINAHQLALYYQPKINLADGRIVSAEALLRWEHPQDGLVTPGHFIAQAEQSQLIGPIGEWVLNRACEDLRTWHDAGLDVVPVSVNLSLTQFQIGNVTQQVQRALHAHQVAPQELTLEITESIFESDRARLRSDLQELRAMGLRLSLDDFGTGYSSLSHLNQYAFDEIKIDRSFIWQLDGASYGRAVVSAVNGIAGALGARVVAEGIESAEQVGALRELGCTTGQGYFYSRPMPESEWRRMLTAERAQLTPLEDSAE